MEPIELRPSPVRTLIILAGAFVIAAVLASFSYTAPEHWDNTGYYLAAIIVVAASLTAARSLRGPAPLTISSEGLTLGDGGAIPWRNLAAVDTYTKRTSWGNREILVLKVKNRDRFIETLDGRPNPLMNHDFSEGWDIQLPKGAFPIPLDEVVDLIHRSRRS